MAGNTRQRIGYCLGFSIAELLVALLILGQIAAFTIPKVLNAQANTQSNAIAKEAAGFVSEAYQRYQLIVGSDANTDMDDLLQYINYVKREPSGLVDGLNNEGSENCGHANYRCYRLHNGAILYWSTEYYFNGTGTNNAIWFSVDPDGKYGGSTTGSSKSVQFFLYFNGRLSTRGEITNGTQSGPIGFNAEPNLTPTWFKW